MEYFLANQAMRWAFLFALLPLIIHLIRRRRAPVIKFAATRFLIESQKKLKQRRLIKELLLLIARMTALGALGFAMAMPTAGEPPEVETEERGAGRLFFVLDASASMHRIQRGETIFDAGRREIRKKIQFLSPQTLAALIKCDDLPKYEFPPAADREAFLNKLEAVKLTYNRCDIPKALALVEKYIDPAEASENRILLLSDFTANMTQMLNSAVIPQGVTVDIIDLFPKEPENDFGIISAEAGGANIGFAEKSSIEITIYAHPNVEEAPDVSLKAESREIARIRPKKKGSYFIGETVFTPPKKGFSIAELSLPRDAQPLNNQFAVPLNIEKPLSALVINGEPSWIDFKDETFFLFKMAASHAGRGGVSLTEIAAPELAKTNIEAFDLIIMANVGGIERAQADRIKRFVETGGGLIVSGGGNIEEPQYDELWGDFLPGVVRGIREGAPMPPTSVDRQHPVLSIFDERTVDAVKSVACRSYLFLKPARAGDNAIISFDDGSPFLVVGRRGKGAAAFIATTIDRDWCNWALNPSFLPIMERLSRFMAGELGGRVSAEAYVGEPILLPPPEKGETLKALLESGAEFIFSGEEASKREFIEISAAENDRPGLITIFRKSEGESGWRASPKETVAVRIRSEELNSQPLGSERVKELLTGEGGERGTTTAKGAVNIVGSSENDLRKPLWRLFLLLLLAAALLESLVGFLPRPKKSGERQSVLN